MIQKQIFSQRLLKAIKTASILFKNIKRTDGYNYNIHLFGVMHIVAQFTDDEDVIIAALMHDTLEDIAPEIYSEINLRTDFGDRVADLVKTVSHFTTDSIGRKQAREIYLDNIGNGPEEAILISAADLINNTADMIYMIKSRTSNMASNSFLNYNSDDCKLRLWFYTERARIISEKLGGDHPLAQEVEVVLSNYKRLVKLD